MSWDIPPVAFEDEPAEEILAARFVKYSAQYPEIDPLQIGDYVFKGLRDPVLRSAQYVRLWLSRLDIREAIRLAKLNGGSEPKPALTKEQRLAQLAVIMQDEDVKAADRINAHRLYAELEKEIGTAAGKLGLPEHYVPAQVVIAQYVD